MYIEQVKYTEPYTLEFIGGDDHRLATYLAQRGYLTASQITTIISTTTYQKDAPITIPPGGINIGGETIYPCAMLPLGAIIMWSGAIADIPDCWQLCDGTPPTPDLRDRFIVGAGSTYAVGATGGSATKDLSHTHADGTLATDTEAAHTHSSGSYATDTEAAHTHGDGSYVTDTEAAHTHDVGTLATASDGSHNHTGVTGEQNANHTHNFTDTSGGPSSTTNYGEGAAGPAKADNIHTHTVSGATGAESATHNHNIVSTGTSHTHALSGATASSGSHAHSVTGTSSSGGSHSHDVAGSSGSDGSHSHDVTGDTALAGSATQDILPPYFALCFIMRVL
jgi:hypothetical protein